MDNDTIHKSTLGLDNISPWLIDEWRESWGEENTRVIADVLMEEPAHLDLSCKFHFIDDERERLSKLEQLRLDLCVDGDALILPHGSIRVKNLSGSIASHPTFKNGSYWVQDASAALPAMALYNALKNSTRDVSSLHVVDMCAAPGGKTAQLVSAGFGKVTAIEANKRRSRRLVENLERLEYVDKCSVAVMEGQQWLPDVGDNVAGILLDTPCSATGTGSRRPDVLRREPDLGNLLSTQQLLLTHCVDNILQVGGVLVYSTCSLLKRESEDQIHKLLERKAKNGGAVVKTVPFTKGEIPGFDWSIDENGWLRVLPGVLPGELRRCDGFFVARLVKE